MQEVEVKGISWIQINKIITIRKVKHVKCKRDFKTDAYEFKNVISKKVLGLINIT